jgi:HlyD family secretion protein
MTNGPNPSATLRASLSPVVVVSVAVGALFVGGFSAWGAFAPLASAAIAPGTVSPDSSRKTVQHLEGGIVEKILVDEGDRVEAGDVLIRLAPTQARASFSARQRQWRRFEALRLRLQALETGAETLSFPAALTAVKDGEYQAFLAGQQALFEIQGQTLSERHAILAQRSAQLDHEVAAVERQNEGLAEQLDILGEEIAAKERLLERQLVPRPEVLALRRARAGLRSQLASNEATIARARQQIEEIALISLAQTTEFRDRVSREMAEVNSELAQLEEAVAASEDVFQRTEVRAPASGTVLGLRTRTVGGIVGPGEAILDIVPADDALVIEARLSPQDIDIVAVGQSARVHLTPYAVRHVPALEGRLVRVSPDSSVDEATRETFYEIRIEVDAEALEADVDLKPGMPAEVFVVTGEQSLFRYIAAPVTRSFRRAFREE